MVNFGNLQTFLFLLLCVALTSGHPQGSTVKHDCGPNSVWSNCASACPDTCDFGSKNDMCTMECNFTCVCLPGFVLNDQQQCVDPREC